MQSPLHGQGMRTAAIKRLGVAFLFQIIPPPRKCGFTAPSTHSIPSAIIKGQAAAEDRGENSGSKRTIKRPFGFHPVVCTQCPVDSGVMYRHEGVMLIAERCSVVWIRGDMLGMDRLVPITPDKLFRRSRSEVNRWPVLVVEFRERSHK
jgi:hypothetical protein